LKKNLSLIIPIGALIVVGILLISNVSSWLFEPECKAGTPLILPVYGKSEISVKEIKILCNEDVEIDTRLLHSEIEKMVFYEPNLPGYVLTVNLEFARNFSDEAYSVLYTKQTKHGKPNWLKLRCELYNRYSVDYEQLLTKTNEALFEVASLE
jgi:hypothetical protein